jgi:carbonic anhydrase/acetyltransferase-like protein (isoleucine patch superfamily)
VPFTEPYNENGNRHRLADLRAHGVDAWGSERVYVDADVNLQNIEPGSSIQNATLKGPGLRIGKDSQIGASGHAFIENCQIGRNVTLGAGSYRGATILDDSRIRDFAELRPGTLVEEQVEVAHSVALKNSVLTATVVTGSLINYCDIFMSGGTSRRQHSEVGSGVIHCNFDPRGDKWSSLVGDVRGVLLRSSPIFIGSQCGLVGPVHLGFGTVIAAGSVVRRGNTETPPKDKSPDAQVVENFDPEIYGKLRNKILITARLVGNLWALDTWYRTVRIPYASDHQRPLYEAACNQLKIHVDERIKRISLVIEKLHRSIEKSSISKNNALISCQDEHRALIKHHRALTEILAQVTDDAPVPRGFIKAYESTRTSSSHLEAVYSVPEPQTEQAAQWLNNFANGYVYRVDNLFNNS